MRYDNIFRLYLLQYKYKIYDEDMTIRGTYLGPIFGEPVQQFQVRQPTESGEIMNRLFNIPTDKYHIAIKLKETPCF
jgi:hypothetical protein